MHGTPLSPILYAKVFGKSGGGGSVTPASVATAIGNMTDAQAEQALSDLGGAGWFPVVISTSGGTIVADKTVAETIAAINAGKIVLVSIPSGSGGTIEAIGTQADGGISAPFTVLLADGMLYIGEVWMHSENGTDIVEVVGYTAAKEPTTVTVSETTPTITPLANTIYQCGELTSLTVTDPPASGIYSIIFVSGSTPTTTNFPASIVFPEAFAPEANTRYEINVSDGYALVGSWPVEESE